MKNVLPAVDFLPLAFLPHPRAVSTGSSWICKETYAHAQTQKKKTFLNDQEDDLHMI
jgi:hypothetical protein